MFISGIVALTLSPVMSAKLIKGGHEEEGLVGRINHGFDRLRNLYARVLDVTLGARPAVYLVWIILSLLTIPMFMMASKELAPSEDQGFILGVMETPADATIDQITFYADAVNRDFMSLPETDRTFQLSSPGNSMSG